MRSIVLFVVLAVGFVGQASAQGVPEESLTYESKTMKVELKVPPKWGIEEFEEGGLRLSPGLDKWESDFPPPNHPWVFVLKPESGGCSLDDRRVPPFTFSRGKSDTYVCKAGWAIVFGYWESDKEQDRHVSEMLEIVASLRPK